MGITSPYSTSSSDSRTVRLSTDPTPDVHLAVEVEFEEPVDARPAYPKQIGNYDIVCEVARAGMGIVYEGFDPLLKRRVAIKIPRFSQVATEETIQRFKTEAEAMAKLQHPHIVAVHEVGWHNGFPFVAMEYLAGKSLHDRLHGRPLRPKEAAALIRDIASAADHAHQHGVLHRDLKPANILYTNDSIPKIIDFGAARFTFESETPPDTSLTQVGTVIGTPQYMAPEQASGDPSQCSPVADIYSLGAILYELLTGVPPFNGVNPYEILNAVQTKDVVSPRVLQPSVPRDLETICLKCLEKKVENRYPTAQALAEDLSRYLNGEPILARPVGLVRRTSRLIAKNRAISGMIFGTLVAGLVGLGAFIWQFEQTVAALGVAKEQAEQAEQATRETDKQKQEALRHLEHSRWNLYRAKISQTQHLLDASNTFAAMMSLDDAPSNYRDWEWSFFRKMCQNSDWTVTLDSPEHLPQKGMWVDKQIVHPSTDRLFVLASDHYDAPGRHWRDNPVSLVMLDSKTGRELGYRYGVMGKHVEIAVLRGDDCLVLIDYHGNIKLVDVRTATDRQVWNAHPDAYPLIADHAVLHHAPVGLTPDGKLCARYCKPHHVELFDPGQPGSKRYVKFDFEYCHPYDISPDGRYLLVREYVNNENGVRDYVYDISSEKIVLRYPVHSPGSAFSPDGKWFVTSDLPDHSRNRIQVWNTHTWQLATTFSLPSYQTGIPFFSPDSRAFVVYNPHRHSFRIYKVDSQDWVEAQGFEGLIRGFAWSPDGQYLATVGDDTMVRIWDPSRGRLLATLRGHTRSSQAVTFSPDGRYVFSGGSGHMVICWNLLRSQVAGGMLSNPNTQREGSTFGTMVFDETNQLRVFDTSRGLMTFDSSSGTLLSERLLESQLLRHGMELSDASFCDAGHLVCGRCQGSPHRVGVWDTSTAKLLRTVDAGYDRLFCAKLSPDGQYLLLSGVTEEGRKKFEGTISLWEVSTGRQLFSKTLPGACFATSIAPNQTIAVSVWSNTGLQDDRQGIYLFDLQGRMLKQLRIPYPDSWDQPKTYMTNVLQFSHHSRYLVANCWDRSSIIVYDCEKGTVIKQIDHSLAITDITFTPNDKRLAITGYQGMVSLFDTDYWEKIASFVSSNDRENDYGYPARVAFSPDGKTMAMNNWRGEIFVWSAERDEDNQQSGQQTKHRTAYRFHLESAREGLRDKNRFACQFHLGRLRKMSPPSSKAAEELNELLGQVRAREMVPTLLGGVTTDLK